MKLVIAIAALLALAPAADARCMPVPAGPAHVKGKAKGCRKMHGARTSVLPVGLSMSPAGLAAPPLDPPAPAPAPAPTPAGDPPPPSPTPPAPTRLGVVAREWSLTLSRTAVDAGPALVELQNFGEDAHNLRIERVDGTGTPLSLPLAEAGEHQRANGTLETGTYRVYCALPGHDAQGMHATLVVR